MGKKQENNNFWQETIKIRGARVNNLKNINLDLPKNRLIVITGLSGSGKSSLAFDTIYAEGQRRYVESLSSYAKQFVGLMNKPDVDLIEGLSPAISIDQRSVGKNPRSTVGTITEIYDYLRLLYARVGTPYCPYCHQEIKAYSPKKIIQQINRQFLEQEVIISTPLFRKKKGLHKQLIFNLRQSNFSELYFDNQYYTLTDFQDLEIDKNKEHDLEIIIGRIIIKKEKQNQIILDNFLKQALDLGNGLVAIRGPEENKIYSERLFCPDCGFSLLEIEPRNFSFNSPHGACPDCLGLGVKLEVNPNLILNKKLTIAQGGIRPWKHNNQHSAKMKSLEKVALKNGFDLNVPLQELNKKQLNIIFYGDKENIFSGVVAEIEERYRATDSEYIRKELENYLQEKVCSTCQGKRLRPEYLAVKINDYSIADLVVLPIIKLRKLIISWQQENSFTKQQQKIVQPILKDVVFRLKLLADIGLGYLSLDRRAKTISGGEGQRIRLATQIGVDLTSVIYVLDEPSIGLHQRDNNKLIATLQQLRDLGNTVIVVEHDEAMMLSADYLVDVGPGAGVHGGEVVAIGTVEDIKNNPQSLTGKYLAQEKQINIQTKNRKGNDKVIKIVQASEHNLKNIDVEIPLGKFVAITGVSGSGKSTLMVDILAKALNKKFYRAKDEPGQHKQILGLENINKVIDIDQSPIGKTPRSNPATYTGLFAPIRELFAEQAEAKLKNFTAGHFSFNVVGGRCEVCKGAGLLKVEMQFLPNVYVQCDACQGKRYQKEILNIYYNGKNIADVLEMTVEDAQGFFRTIPSIYHKLKILSEVGLGYITLGQPATTLSGGEAQRVKLATELSRRSTGKTFYILDEPTTGLHFDDIQKLLRVLNKLVDKGNTVLIIEHNLDVIKSVDWIIDLGPEGGEEGGQIIAQGSPAQIAQETKSYTGQYLAPLLKKNREKE